jgi:hypothetical protein
VMEKGAGGGGGSWGEGLLLSRKEGPLGRPSAVEPVVGLTWGLHTTVLCPCADVACCVHVLMWRVVVVLEGVQTCWRWWMSCTGSTQARVWPTVQPHPARCVPQGVGHERNGFSSPHPSAHLSHCTHAQTQTTQS